MKMHRCFCSLFLTFACICFFTYTAGAFEITSFCPDTWLQGEGDEFFVISGSGDLSSVMVSDGEGSIRFSEGSMSDGSVIVALKGAEYIKVHGSPPDYEIYDTDPGISDVIRSGTLRMGNSGDELTLFINKKAVQEIVWPGSFKTGEGRIHVLDDGVWDLRPYYIGQSGFSPVTYENATVRAFVSPDCSYEVLEDAISGAKSLINLNVYEFTSPDISGMMAQKSSEGVCVRVLLEGGPVGGISSSEDYAVSDMVSGGALVYKMETENGAYHAPYRYDHAKYMTADGASVLVASENFGCTGFPKPGTSGNRGFGVYITDSGAASYFDSVFEADISGGWSIPYTEKAGSPGQPCESDYSPDFVPEYFSGVSVTPVISPDTSYLIEDMIDDAKVSVAIEQAYIKNWSCKKNPYLEAAVSAAERGVSVRVILDSYWYNTQGESDNDEMADYINSVAAEKDLDLRAVLADLESLGVEKIHNKAVITDGESVLISSVNWNENSPLYNREAGVILKGGGAAKYYLEVFDHDWEMSTKTVTAPAGDAPKEGGLPYLKPLAGFLVIVCFAAFYLKKRII